MSEVKAQDQEAQTETPRAIREDATPGTIKIDKSALENIALNSLLKEFDERIRGFGLRPEAQMGVLMMAQCLAFRRLLEAQGIRDRGRRHKLIKLATQDFQSKLVKHTVPPVETTTAQGN